MTPKLTDQDLQNILEITAIATMLADKPIGPDRKPPSPDLAAEWAHTLQKAYRQGIPGLLLISHIRKESLFLPLAQVKREPDAMEAFKDEVLFLERSPYYCMVSVAHPATEQEGSLHLTVELDLEPVFKPTAEATS